MKRHYLTLSLLALSLLLSTARGGEIGARVPDGHPGMLPGGREILSLNRSWRFTPGHETRKNVYAEVNLPHTWNQDALAGKADYYRGVGNYEKRARVPETWRGKRIFLRFKGVNSVANVFINGKHVGEHRGGYTAFVFEITGRVTAGEEFALLVRVNNAIQLDVMPLVGDFNMYGGIYRDVELIAVARAHVSLTDHASPGIYVTTREISARQATGSLKVMVTGPAGKVVTTSARVKDARGNAVWNGEREVTCNGEMVAVMFDAVVSNPRLWQGREDPYLYTVEVAVSDEAGEVDRVQERWGVREYAVDPDRGFFLNGRRVQLRGVCRHQDRAEIGNALSPAHHREDMELIREMGANAIRLAHYPQDRLVHDLCDQLGFVVWAEIPFVGPGGYRDKGFVDQPSFRSNGRQQLTELIRQNYNHPSICFWGLFNELKEEGDNPVEYLRELRELAAREDPSRRVTAATNQGGEINRVTDLVAWNLYFGWYGGEPSSIGAWADKTRAEYAGIPVGISEYGAGASILHHEEALARPAANSYWHPEGWQAYFHEEHWKAIDQRPFLWGTFIWNMFDFGAAHRTEGEINGKNDKGLVTFDRKVKKDAFYFYKANWNSDDPFVHVAGRRGGAPRQVKVYSNCPEVELLVNGHSLGKRRGERGIFSWEEVAFVPGENRVTARARGGHEDSVTFFAGH
ncbi:MAG: glycoside hydrolase family 2 protein [Odoribacteraceae bacterium]|jgi:beta-galactosidase|nr:glycoside hydrolase family 2 protein [Odoribacteraceae bacterium]